MLRREGSMHSPAHPVKFQKQVVAHRRLKEKAGPVLQINQKPLRDSDLAFFPLFTEAI